jgi:hypothetical protein
MGRERQTAPAMATRLPSRVRLRGCRWTFGERSCRAAVSRATRRAGGDAGGQGHRRLGSRRRRGSALGGRGSRPRARRRPHVRQRPEVAHQLVGGAVATARGRPRSWAGDGLGAGTRTATALAASSPGSSAAVPSAAWPLQPPRGCARPGPRRATRLANAAVGWGVTPVGGVAGRGAPPSAEPELPPRPVRRPTEEDPAASERDFADHVSARVPAHGDGVRRAHAAQEGSGQASQRLMRPSYRATPPGRQANLTRLGARA